jgi:hypothetical protein
VTLPGDPPAGPPPGGWLAEVKARRAGMPADPLEVVVTPAEEEYYMVWRIVEHGPPDKYGCRERLAWFPEGEAEAAEFFAHAPADTDRLVAEVTRLRQELDLTSAELFRQVTENNSLREMLGRDGKDSGRMWHDRAQRIKRQGREALDAYAERLREATAEVTRLRGRLGELEWAGTLQPGYACCPACEYPKGFGAVPGPHEEGCWLAAELGR